MFLYLHIHIRQGCYASYPPRVEKKRTDPCSVCNALKQIVNLYKQSISRTELERSQKWYNCCYHIQTNATDFPVLNV